MPDELSPPSERPIPLSPTSFPVEPSTSSPQQQQASSGLNDKVREDMSAVKDGLKSGADSAIYKAKSAASAQASAAVRQVQGIATAFQKVGAELEGTDQPTVGRYTNQIGASIQQLAEKMEGKDIGQIANLAEDFGRKQPLAFLGLAALAGMTASRFLTASAKRTETASSNASDTPRDAIVTGGTGNV